MLVPFDHVQSHTGFHIGALGLSIGRFCRAYDHARNSTRIDGFRICDRSHATTGADHAPRPEQITTAQRFSLKTSSKSALSSYEKSNSLFQVKSEKIEQKFPKMNMFL